MKKAAISFEAEIQKLKENLAEKNLLLSLTKDLARIKGRKELMHLIKERFQRMFEFEQCTISTLSADKQTFRIFYIDPAPSEIKKHKEYKKLVTERNPVNDGLYNLILQSATPVVFDINAMSTAGNGPFYVDVLKRGNIKELLGVVLMYENEPLGILSFISKDYGGFKPVVFPLVQSIAYQISPSVINTLTLDAIRQREQAMLLERGE